MNDKQVLSGLIKLLFDQGYIFVDSVGRIYADERCYL